jgi:galactokinase/mevalonate kinase-like predicted kinase
MAVGAALRASAPARANLIGNPSDLYGGAVLGCSVDRRAFATIAPDERLVLASGGEEFAIADAAELVPRGDRFDVARAVLADLDELPAARIAFQTEIPFGGGLAGSTALLVALLRGLLAWRGESTGAHALAERARRIERERLGVACGYVDHYLCTFGGLAYVDFRGKAEEAPDAPDATVEPLSGAVSELPFVLAFTGVAHHSGSVHAPIRARWERGDRDVRVAYRRIGALAREGRAALLRGEWKRLGALMNENHAIQRDLGGSGEANERLIEAARAAGAPGAKLAGAGGGGTIVALWPGADAAPLESALRAAGAVSLDRPRPVPGVHVEPIGKESDPWPTRPC